MGLQMRVIVDMAKCCGYGMCVEVCPQIFRLDENGISHADDPEVPKELESQAKIAVHGCPQAALSLDYS